MRFRFGTSKRVCAALVAATLTATAAGAATVHRFSVSQTTGSEGAQAYIQSSASSSALQAEVTDSTPNMHVKLPFGLLGEYDPSGSTFGIGVAGISTTGYGVGGESLGTGPSVFGYSGGTGTAVEGLTPSTSSGSVAIFGDATKNGLAGYFYSEFGPGLTAFSNSGDGSGAGGGGVARLAKADGTAVEADGYSGNTTAPVLAAYDTVGKSDLLATYSCDADVNDICQEPESFVIQAGSANRSGETTGSYSGAADAQISGDLYVFGKVYQQCGDFPATSSTYCVNDAGADGTSGVTRSAAGNDVKVYSDAQSVRTVEDFGTARLANGRGFVPLDAAYGATISRQAPYLVFVTPDGDCRGLYVSGKSAAGFTVSELGGGRSTLNFDYRIVATPLDDNSRRFVAVVPKHRIPGYNMRKRTALDDPKAIASRLNRTIPPVPLALTR